MSGDNIFATEFEDINKNTHKLNHSFTLSEQERKDMAEQIAEQLCNIFTKKIG